VQHKLSVLGAIIFTLLSFVGGKKNFSYQQFFMSLTCVAAPLCCITKLRCTTNTLGSSAPPHTLQVWYHGVGGCH